MTSVKRAAGIVGGAAGLAAVAGFGYVAANWLRFGRVRDDGRQDPMLDRYLPVFDVREYHEIRVSAPAGETYDAVRQLDLRRSRVIRAIFRGREILLGGAHVDEPARSLVEQTLALGWGKLAEKPGREIVMGAITRPWEANVRFWTLPAEEFACFDEPGYVKIVWTLAVTPLSSSESTAHTETRVLTTDARARSRFRRYWALVSPGVALIRRQALRIVKADAERRQQSEQ